MRRSAVSTTDAVVFSGGSILTMDDPPRAEAVAVADGRIRAVGLLRECRDAAGRAARQIDLAGRCLVPGFVDAHTHPLMVGQCGSWVDCGVEATPTIERIVAALAERATTLPPDAPVCGYGYNHGTIADRRHPTAADLDRVAVDRVVLVMHSSGHGAVVNSFALHRMGVRPGTVDPSGGTIGRDVAGRPNGLLWDAAADLLTGPDGVKIGNHGPNFHFAAPAKDLGQMLDLAQATFLRAGITTVGDAQVTRRELETYLAFRDEGRLVMRVSMMVLSSLLGELTRLGLCSHLGDDRLAFAGLKLYADGALTAWRAHVSTPYAFDPCDRGLRYHEPGELQELIVRAHTFGLQTGTHAQGDAAIGMVLDAVAEAQRLAPRVDVRHRLEHCGLPTRKQVARIAELGLVPVPQPMHFVDHGDALLAVLGDRAHDVYPYGWFAAHGIPIVLSSDAPTSTPHPLAAVAGAALRRTAGGRVLGRPDQRISVTQALWGYTMGGAIALHREHAVGSIAPGKLADFAVLHADPLTLDASALPRLGVTETWVAGERVS
jgi:predicted amidohydrolase YtcJ